MCMHQRQCMHACMRACMCICYVSVVSSLPVGTVLKRHIPLKSHTGSSQKNTVKYTTWFYINGAVYAVKTKQFSAAILIIL